MDHLLDNPIWHALNSGNSHLSFGNGEVKHFSEDVAFFAGLKYNDEKHLAILHEMLPPGRKVYLFTPEVVVPDAQHWQKLYHMNIYQMVFEGELPGAEPDPEIIPLGKKDIPDILDLIELTNPGPFGRRTINFGNYFGIYSDGKLVSMTGQRLHPSPYLEVSAVCTRPGYNGRGYARSLISHQLHLIKAASCIPFLHVDVRNTSAAGLYTSLGFRVRRELIANVIQHL